MTGSSEQSRQASRRGLLLQLAAVLALLGVANGIYLSIVHIDYALGKPSELAMVCSQLAPQGCSVTVGRFGELWGIPISVLGLGGSAAMAVVAVIARTRRTQVHDPWRSLLFILATLSVLASITMAILSGVEGSYCPFCVGWYALNLTLGFVAWLALHPAALGPHLIQAVNTRASLVATVVFVVSTSLAHGLYGRRYNALRVELGQVIDAMVAQTLQEPATPLDLSDLPTRGPEDATLTIVEVADFQCPFCRRLWQSIHDYTEDTTLLVRVAFVHYPLDDRCNPGVDGMHPMACLAAEAAQCAHRQDRFWDYGDLLFANQPALEYDDLLHYASELSLDIDAFTQCLDSHDTALEVRRSIARAILMGVEATPTFFVNGHKFKGALPKAWMPLMLDKMARAGEPAP